MKKLVSLTVALLLLLLCACGENKDKAASAGGSTDPDSTLSDSAPQPQPDGSGDSLSPDTPAAAPDTDTPAALQPLTWSDRVFTGTYSDESLTKDPLVLLTLYLPKVSGCDDIDLYYQAKLDRMKEAAQTTYLDLGRGNYKFSSNGIGIFSPVTVELSYKVLHNDGKLFSVRREVYEHTGGAHPSVVIQSETFRVSDGALMIFSDLLSVPFDEASAKLKPLIEEIMDEKIKENGEAYYFQNAKDDLFTMWDSSDWYLTDEYLVMYWQTYAISPYVSGIQEFFIPLDSVADIIDSQWIS